MGNNVSRTMLLTIVVLSHLCFIGCAGKRSFDGPVSLRALPRNSGPFTGTWHVSLTPTQDACGFGLTKPITTDLVIRQSGNTATITAPSLPTYHGKVGGNTLIASGKYNYSGLKLSGTINASLASRNKIRIGSSRLNVKGSTGSCYMIFTGKGTRA